MKKCYLHIGNFKTGSTSFQKFLFQNRKKFESQKFEVIYDKNIYFKKTINNLRIFKLFSDKKFNILKKILTKRKDLILSSEYFSSLSFDLEKIKLLQNFFKKLSYKLIIIYFYRDDNEFLYSLYSEILKHRKRIEVENIFDFLKFVKEKGYFQNKKNKIYFLNFKYPINNKIVIKNWKKVFGENFNYFKFDKSNNKSILQFLRLINLNKKDFDIRDINLNKTRNIKFWHIKRKFYYNFLKSESKKINFLKL